MVKSKVNPAVLGIGCMDSRERVVESHTAKSLHILDMVSSGNLRGDHEQFVEFMHTEGILKAFRTLQFFRGAGAGGGYTLNTRQDIDTILDNGLNVIAVESTRHRLCKAINKGKHYDDASVAIMFVIDCDVLEINRPPMYRAHLEVETKHEEFEANEMDIEALIAHGLLYGVNRNFRSDIYCPKVAAQIIGLDPDDKVQLQVAADRVNIDPVKGLIKFDER